MSKRINASSGQMALDAFAKGSIVHLDGGLRLRLDNKVDFWPATGAWQSLVSDQEGQGATTMLAFIMAERQIEGQVPQPATVKTRRKVSCNLCGKRAALYGGDVVYPGRQDLAHRHFWVCWPCNAWVGAIAVATGRRRSACSPTQALRDARRAAHAAFDPIWQGSEMARIEAYAWLSDATGIPPPKCHIGWMDLAQCQRVIDAVMARADGWVDGKLDVGGAGPQSSSLIARGES